MHAVRAAGGDLNGQLPRSMEDGGRGHPVGETLKVAYNYWLKVNPTFHVRPSLKLFYLDNFQKKQNCGSLGILPPRKVV